jgi:hypothetical protein
MAVEPGLGKHNGVGSHLKIRRTDLPLGLLDDDVSSVLNTSYLLSPSRFRISTAGS